MRGISSYFSIFFLVLCFLVFCCEPAALVGAEEGKEDFGNGSGGIVRRAGGVVGVDSQCYPDLCAEEETDTFFSYTACCDNECCNRLRYWVYPASIAAVGFIAGAFFALCFQCR
ncbi:unnamed protein product [Caenorhabditis angaria]|uniref:Uncharacterized protein n=1 Tax=Caenorhabditis angaria TaxID=860376 RepID=A0A9P1MYR7_9PELO|nr:unnamed protein product [Caenorhabditis angaria]